MVLVGTAQEVAVQMSARAAVIRRFGWGWSTHWQDGALTPGIVVLAVGLSFSPDGPLPGLLKCVNNVVTFFPQRKEKERQVEAFLFTI